MTKITPPGVKIWNITKKMKLLCDNQVALHIASNSTFDERTNHMKVESHFVTENISSRCLAKSLFNSNDQLADIFTKSLKGPQL